MDGMVVSQGPSVCEQPSSCQHLPTYVCLCVVTSVCDPASGLKCHLLTRPTLATPFKTGFPARSGVGILDKIVLPWGLSYTL
jgi:hypothetical protein